MLEARSALQSITVYETFAVTLREEPISNLTLVSGTDKALKKVFGKLPSKVGHLTKSGGASLLRVGPRQFWVIDSDVPKADDIYITPLGSSRTCILVQGPLARDLLASCVPIDFHITSFAEGQFVMTGIHHTPVTIHCIDATSFHVYVLRTFAFDVWSWLQDIAEGMRQQNARNS